MNVIVQASGLSRRYGRQWALRDLELTLHEGEAVALLGANGAGKSTLLNILATVLRPSEGQLRILDRNPRKEAAAIRQSLGYMAHATLLDDALSALENLIYYGNLFGVDQVEMRARRLLDEMGLELRAEDRVDGFSRGMRQRLSLARALLHRPRLMVLDEPFTGLDIAGCRDLASRLSQEKDRGVAMILATHQLGEVLPWCDRVLVLHQGRGIEENPASRFNSAGWAQHLTQIAEGCP